MTIGIYGFFDMSFALFEKLHASLSVPEDEDTPNEQTDSDPSNWNRNRPTEPSK